MVGVDPWQWIPHSDNGGPMKGATMAGNSYGEVQASEYPHRPFKSLEDARRWVNSFVGWYNDKHRHSAIRFVTPSQKHSGEEKAILCQRKEVYKQARKLNPSRWTGSVRNWKSIEKVILNPLKAQTVCSSGQQRTA